MRKQFPALALSVFAATMAAALPATAQTAILDGRVFVGDAGEKGKPADEKGDVVTFSGGMFHSSSCDQYG
jgi:hypothetical protein